MSLICLFCFSFNYLILMAQTEFIMKHFVTILFILFASGCVTYDPSESDTPQEEESYLSKYRESNEWSEKYSGRYYLSYGGAYDSPIRKTSKTEYDLLPGGSLRIQEYFRSSTHTRWRESTKETILGKWYSDGRHVWFLMFIGYDTYEEVFEIVNHPIGTREDGWPLVMESTMGPVVLIDMESPRTKSW